MKRLLIRIWRWWNKPRPTKGSLLYIAKGYSRHDYCHKGQNHVHHKQQRSHGHHHSNVEDGPWCCLQHYNEAAGMNELH